MPGASTVMTAAGFSLSGPKMVAHTTTSFQRCRPGHVLVETAYLGLCGTDRELFLGTHSYLAEGVSAYPLVPGHEWSGTIRAVGTEVVGLHVGDRVTGDPFITCGVCQMCRTQRRNLCTDRSKLRVRGHYSGAAAGLFEPPAKICTPLPPLLSLEEAVLVEPAVTVLEGLHRTRAASGDTMAVIGTGTLGLIAVMLPATMGITVHAVGLSAPARALARTLGATDATLPQDAPTARFSVVLDASGSPDGFAQAVALAVPGGRIALLGMPTQTHPIDTTTLVAKDLEIHGVLGGVGHYATAVHAVTTGALNAAALIDTIYELDEISTAYQQLAEPGRSRPKVLLRFPSAAQQNQTPTAPRCTAPPRRTHHETSPELRQHGAAASRPTDQMHLHRPRPLHHHRFGHPHRHRTRRRKAVRPTHRGGWPTFNTLWLPPTTLHTNRVGAHHRPPTSDTP